MDLLNKTSQMQAIEARYNECISDLLFKFYWDENKSTSDIGKIFSISKTTVSRWMKQFNIPHRSQSEGKRLLWQNAEYRQRNIDARSKDEYRSNISEKIKQQWQNDLHRLQMSIKGKKRWRNKEFRHKMLRIYQSKEYKQKQSDIAKKIWHNKEHKQQHKLTLQSDEYREKRSNIAKGLWQNKEYRDKVLYSRNSSPNNLESFVDSLTPLKIKFVGDGSFWRYLPLLGKSKNPDFKVDGQPKVIEVFGDYWHANDNAEELVRAFAGVGIQCLVLWESEIYNDTDGTLGKIADFINETNWQLSLPFVG